MVYILHGENLSGIRNFILKLQKDNDVGSKKELLIEDVSSSEIAELVSAVDMFGVTTMVVLDVTKMGRMKVDNYVKVLSDVPEDLIFVILTNKSLSKANGFIKNAATMNARTLLFKETSESSVFKFVDQVFGGNRDAAYSELRKLLLSGVGPFYIFSMLTYGLRNVAYAKFDSPAFDKLPPFVKSKVKSQAQKLSEPQIAYLYRVFYSLDKGSKQGLMSSDLLPVYALEKVLTYN